MTAPAPLLGGFEETEMYEVLRRACAVAGLNSSDAEVIRGQSNAVIRLRHDPVIVKIASRGSSPVGVEQTVAFVRWLMELGYPTVPLHPVPQPVLVDGHAVTFWKYLPQDGVPIAAADLAMPLRALHQLPRPVLPLRQLDHIAAIRSSLAVAALLTPEEEEFLARRAERLERELDSVEFVLPEAVIQEDPQHGNALRDGGQTVLCDWDTVVWGRPEWDLVTVEIHCRRFGHGQEHYDRFADEYGFDVMERPGYRVLRDIRELRMITTNARKAGRRPNTLGEVRRRIVGLRSEDSKLRWHIL